MKILKTSVVALFTFSAGLAAVASAAPRSGNPLVNAYGEAAGFGHLPDVILPNSKDTYWSNSNPGSAGMYVFPGSSFDSRNSESIGIRQARIAAELPGTVIIGAPEVIDSGPTGPMAPAAQAAASEEVTAQVLGRIKATDRIMSSLKSRSKSLDEDTQTRFKAAAAEVAERREALRENLKNVRAAGESQWSDARSAVAVSFNAYVQSQHRAEAIVSGSANS